MAYRVDIENPSFEFLLAKGAGRFDLNVKDFSAPIHRGIYEYGLKQLAADSAVNFHLAAERPPEKRKETDIICNSKQEMWEGIRAKFTKRVEGWLKGEWTIGGPGRVSDPVGQEKWAILFKSLDILPGKQSEARKHGQNGLAEMIVLQRLKGKKVSAEKMAELTQGILNQVQKRAEENVARRTEEFTIDLQVA